MCICTYIYIYIYIFASTYFPSKCMSHIFVPNSHHYFLSNRQKRRRRPLSERLPRKRPPKRPLRRRRLKRKQKPRRPPQKQPLTRRNLLLLLRLLPRLPRPRLLSSISLRVVRLALVLSRVAKLVERYCKRRSFRLVRLIS